MVGWHHRLHGREVEQAAGDGVGRGSLAVRWVAGSGMTERLNDLVSVRSVAGGDLSRHERCSKGHQAQAPACLVFTISEKVWGTRKARRNSWRPWRRFS